MLAMENGDGTISASSTDPPKTSVGIAEATAEVKEGAAGEKKAPVLSQEKRRKLLSCLY